ncbi:DUF1015 domain-containing protein [Aquiflexum sp.]|uniref:DUF1015 domain-containing protein n=1 Tax=Aquiflexum sp. TaxID=1872584 RepID=UPI003592F29A
MAEILPLKGWRYHSRFKNNLDDLTSPLFDVVSEKQRVALYQNPYNSIHISVPLGDDPSTRGKEVLEKWKSEKVIIQDQLPGIYVYYQYFRLPGQEHESCRKGFIAQIKAYDWDEGVVLRHENTIVQAVADRTNLLRSTEFQPSPTHGLYEDLDHLLEPYMDAAIEDPIYDLEDYQGVREVMGLIQDARIIKVFLEVIKDRTVILADGHHRYQSAIDYKKEKTSANPNHTCKEAYNFHMMYFTNALARDLKILPTHRLFFDLDLKEEEILQKAGEFFIIKKLNDVEEIGELILQKQWAFGLVFKNNAYKIRLIPEKIGAFGFEMPQVVKEVDLMVLHYFFIDKVLGISFKEQRLSNNIDYERNLNRCFSKVNSGTASCAVITKEVPMSQVLNVCKSGFTMPQKSTYFYPKALSGLLFGSVNEEEFKFPYQAFK